MKDRSFVFLVIAAWLGLTQPGLRAQDEADFPLPRWSEEELRVMREGGPEASPLLNNLLWPENEDALAEATPAPADSPDARQPTADLSRFLPPHLIASPGAGRSLPSAFVATASSSLREVSAGFLIEAANWPSARHLIDPNSELAETMQEDFARFLEFHARDADIRMHVLLLGRDEKLPANANANLATVAQGSLQQGRACLAVIPRGEPWRLRLFLSREVHSIAPSAELSEMFEDCVRDAMQATDEDEQLHRLLVRLSIRLFWLERLVPKQKSRPLPAIVASKAEEALPEITAAPQPQPALPWTRRLSLVLAVLLALALVAWRWRCYKMRHYVWTLPEREILPRLGGAHCGGGTWIDYR